MKIFGKKVLIYFSLYFRPKLRNTASTTIKKHKNKQYSGLTAKLEHICGVLKVYHNLKGCK